jgi:hypothetical protein
MTATIIPPPPMQPLSSDRALYDWLYVVYAAINGLDPSADMTGAEDSPPAAGVADLAVTSRMASDSIMLAMRADVDRIRADVDRLMLMIAPMADAPDQLRAMVQAAQANIGAIQKRIDEVMIWQ